MATNQPFTQQGFNQINLNRTFRETPAIPSAALPASAVNSAVPFEAPNTAIPSNTQFAFQNSGAMQLARSLGGLPEMFTNIGEKVQEGFNKRQEARQSREYYAGLKEAHTRASETRDVFTTLTQEGLMPSHRNPWRIKGYQAGMLGEAVSQYRREVVEARISNPTATQDEILDGINQKYEPILSSVDPALAAKFFLEPIAAIRNDDFKLMEKNLSETFNDRIGEQVGSSIRNTITTELQLLRSGQKDVKSFQANVAAGVEQILLEQSASGTPYKPAIQNVFRVVSAMASQEEGHHAKLEVLDSLKGIKLPSGSSLLDSPAMLEQYVKTRDKLITQAGDEAKAVAAENDLKQQEKTAVIVDKIWEDTSKPSGAADKQSYIRDAVELGADPEEAAKAYEAATNGIQSQPESTAEDARTVLGDMLIDGVPTEIIVSSARKYRDNGTLSQRESQSFIDDAKKRDRQEKQDAKPPSWNVKLMDTQTELPNMSVGLDAISLRRVAQAGIANPDKALRNSIKGEFQREIQGYVENNPDVSPEQLMNYIDNRGREVWEPMFERKAGWIRSYPEQVRGIINGTWKPSQSTKYTATSFAQPAKPKTQLPTTSKAPAWATNKESYDSAWAQFRLRKGPLYDILKAQLKRAGRPELTLKRWSQIRKGDKYFFLKPYENLGITTFDR